jgi:serine/threonine protein kinase
MSKVMPLQAGDHRRMDRYRLTGRFEDRPSADGAIPPVFLAKTPDGSTVVVSLLPRERVVDAAARDRFAAEARVARRVAPFCAARILDAGVEGDDPYIVTEHVPGLSLAEVVGDEGPLPGPALEAVAIGTATGLAAIHQAGLVHGAFGPDHVILGPDGPRVTHFSINPPYGPATPAADMLAWAHTVMFSALGRPPVGPQDLAALPENLRAAAAACVTPDPAGRPAARAVLAQLLGRYDPTAGLLAEGAKQARAAARVPVPASSRRRERGLRRSRSRAVMWVMACATCLVAIAVATVYITRHHPSATAAAASSSPLPGSSTALPQPVPSVTVPVALTGKWQGTVHQTSPVLTVTVQISLPAGSSAGTIAYPELSCSGGLTLVSVTAGGITLDQTIDTGQKNCPNGVIRLKPLPTGSLAFTFQRRSGISPAGILTRLP